MAGLHHAVMNNVVDHGTIRVDGAQEYSLCSPPRVFGGFRGGRGTVRGRGNEGDGIEDLGEPAQCPFLVQPRRQDPFALGLCLDLQAALFSRLACFPAALGLLQQLDLLVGVDVDALRRQTRDQWAGKRLVRDGGVRVHVELRPVVLELEVVLDLDGERLQLRKVRSVERNAIERRKGLLQRGRHDCRFRGRNGRHDRHGVAGRRLEAGNWWLECFAWRGGKMPLCCCGKERRWMQISPTPSQSQEHAEKGTYASLRQRQRPA